MSNKDARKLFFELTGEVFSESGAQAFVEFNSFDPTTGEAVGFLDSLACWQTLTQVLISSLEDAHDPEDLVNKLRHAYDVVFPNDRSKFHKGEFPSHDKTHEN